jgi:hypothetical protein
MKRIDFNEENGREFRLCWEILVWNCAQRRDLQPVLHSRFVCPGVWCAGLAERACAAACIKSGNDPCAAFDRQYRTAFQYSSRYSALCNPTCAANFLRAGRVKSCKFVAGMVELAFTSYHAEIFPKDGEAWMEFRHLPGYDKKYFRQMVGLELRGFMISWDDPFYPDEVYKPPEGKKWKRIGSYEEDDDEDESVSSDSFTVECVADNLSQSVFHGGVSTERDSLDEQSNDSSHVDSFEDEWMKKDVVLFVATNGQQFPLVRCHDGSLNHYDCIQAVWSCTPKLDEKKQKTIESDAVCTSFIIIVGLPCSGKSALSEHFHGWHLFDDDQVADPFDDVVTRAIQLKLVCVVSQNFCEIEYFLRFLRAIPLSVMPSVDVVCFANQPGRCYLNAENRFPEDAGLQTTVKQRITYLSSVYWPRDPRYGLNWEFCEVKTDAANERRLAV